MRRYLVRFAVAVLTFAIGVAISISLGLFKPRYQDRAFAYREGHRCGKRFVVQESVIVQVPRVETIDASSPAVSIENTENQPLKLTYLSSNSDSYGSPKQQMRFLVTNRSNDTVEAYAIDWHTAANGEQQRSGSIGSDMRLKPGATEVVTITRERGECMYLRFANAEFADGSRWNNLPHAQGVLRDIP
jgi:hypothetical protein